MRLFSNKMTFKQSPNYNQGRNGNKTTKIVTHWVGSGTYESAVSWLTNPASKVSAHYVISGDRVTQCVKEEDTAWHAGNLTVNRTSIGIEHDAISNKPATETTYKTSAKLISEICKRYSIPIDREHIIKHSEVKPTACPGTMDLDKLVSLAKGLDMNFIDLKKRLSDTSWSELKEFTSLEKLGLIERADSIQTMTQKWLKSNSDMAINQARSLELLAERDKTIKDLTIKHAELQILHDVRGETIVNLKSEISSLKLSLETLKTSSTAEVDLLLEQHKKEIRFLEEDADADDKLIMELEIKNRTLELAIVEETKKRGSSIITIDFSKLISFLETWKKK